MRPDSYKVIQRAIEEGVAYGVRRYYKHRDAAPAEVDLNAMADEIAEHTLNEVCEWFRFDDDGDGI